MQTVNKIISGGQTGADQGGLDAAIELSIPHGGWCPAGRRSEDGQIPSKYNLKSHDSYSYPPRTEQNVIDSDGTIIFTINPLETGSELTRSLCRKHNKPSLVFYIDDPSQSIGSIESFLENNSISTLNVAGSRESKVPGIQEFVKLAMIATFKPEYRFYPTDEGLT